MIAAVINPIARFAAWWFGELAACLPSRLRQRLAGRRHLVTVDYGEDGVTLRQRIGSRWRDLGDVPIDPAMPAAAAAACRERLRGIRLGSADIVLRLPADRVLQRRVELPLAAAENLREVLGFEMDRLTPFRAEDVAYDFSVGAVDREAQRLAVDLAVAPRALVEDSVHVATTLGLPPDRVGVAADDLPDVNLLAAAEGTSSNRGHRRLSFVLAFVALVLLAVAVLWPLHRKQEELAALEARLAESRAAAAAAADLRERIDSAIARNEFLAQRRQATSPMVVLLKELTERLADDSWLVQLRITGDSLMLSGYAPAAAALLSVLEASPRLTDLRFSAPVMPDARVGRERFNLAARITATAGE